MAKHPGGRPTKFNTEICNLICERLTYGESLRAICRDDSMPYVGTVLRWMVKDGPEYKEFRRQYELARQLQAETYADEITKIADDAEPGTVQVQRLRVDARKWVASKLKPKKYGDRQAVEVSVGIEDRLRKLWESKNKA